jgi:hypothetical protein
MLSEICACRALAPALVNRSVMAVGARQSHDGNIRGYRESKHWERISHGDAIEHRHGSRRRGRVLLYELYDADFDEGGDV